MSEEVWIEKARELFALCDVEQKGFISKRDMQRLLDHLPIQPEHLEDVFDTLDNDKNGFLTLDEFTDGFGQFLGVQKAPTQAEDNDGLGIYEDSERQSDIDDAQFVQMMDNIGITGAVDDDETKPERKHKASIDSVKNLWSSLRRDNPDLLPTFEGLLNRVSGEMKKTQQEYHSLETVLKTKSSEHDDEVRRLYEEMEAQIRAEKERLVQEERAKEKVIREELEIEMFEKEKTYQETLKKQEDLQRRLEDMNSVHAETAAENEKLLKEKEELEEQLDDCQASLDESQSYIEELQKKTKDDRRRRAKAAIEMTEGIALEREELVRQLHNLRDKNKQLKDAKDEGGHMGLGGLDADGCGEAAGDGLHAHHDNANATAACDACGDDEVSLAIAAGGENLGDALNQFGDRRGGGDSDEDDFECDEDLVDYVAPTTPPDQRAARQQLLYESDEEDEGDAAARRRAARRSRPAGGSGGVHRTGSILVETACQVTDTDDELERRGGRPPGTRGCEIQTMTGDSISDALPASASGANAGGEPDMSQDRLSPEGTEDLPYEPVFSTNKNPERVFKVVFIGDSGVGKSSIIHRFCYGQFKSTFSATIGVDFQIKSLLIDDFCIALQLWDTAGQERFRSITKQYFRKADGVVIVYDLTQEATFINVRSWMMSVEDGTDEQTVKMVLANKTDLSADDSDKPSDTPSHSQPIGSHGEVHRAIKTVAGEQLAEEYGALFFEVSAKSGYHVAEAFQTMASALKETEDYGMKNAITVSANIEKKKGCCASKK